MNRITPCLWFDGKAEEAAKFYTSVFENSKILNTTRYGESAAAASGNKPGAVMTVEFEIDGQRFLGLNGGPAFHFSEAISFIVNCKTQRELDHFWTKLSEGGEEGPCGWLKDKFGLSWQVVPTALSEMMKDKDPKKAERVMAAVMKMKKLDIEELEAAYSDAYSKR